MAYPVLGIPVRDWVAFLSLHRDAADPAMVTEMLQKQLTRRNRQIAEDAAAELLVLVERMREIIEC